jgi:hypothetical protein
LKRAVALILSKHVQIHSVTLACREGFGPLRLQGATPAPPADLVRDARFPRRLRRLRHRPLAAQAAPILHHEVADFASITAVQGRRGSGAAAPSRRSSLGKMLDADDVNRFFSLGLGGTLTLARHPAASASPAAR